MCLMVKMMTLRTVLSTSTSFCSYKMLLCVLSKMRQPSQKYGFFVKAIVTKKGNLKGYGTVWFHQERITNILSLRNVQKLDQCDVRQYSISRGLVHNAYRYTLVFRPSKKGYSPWMLKTTLDKSFYLSR